VPGSILADGTGDAQNDVIATRPSQIERSLSRRSRATDRAQNDEWLDPGRSVRRAGAGDL